MTRKHIFVIFTILFFAVNLIAQKDVWPVQISGSMTPPHSLNLQVYGFERTEDLSFQLLLKDPVEANLLVRPVITIEQNGNIIYQTDPNFGGDPILLSQFEQMMINGSVLQKYLSNTALIGAKVNSTGSVEVPEGFNQICLQLYGVDRDVPVSNKFCISGNFRLNQPPQIVKPAFNEKIKMPLVQNMIFSWQAMHLGSGNNPGPVEYTFELVELPMGVMNANDAFESSLRIYNTKTTATSLIYSPAEPKLDPDKYYAWRVTATSIMYPTSKLFQNDGKSEVSMFVLYDGDAPTSEINPFDNSSPRGCSVYETAYGPVTKADNEPMIAAPNQSVKLGYFNMKITEVSGNQQVGFSGKGLVEYPMLRSILEVDFKNIQINKEGRVYQSERISAIIDPALAMDVNNVSKDKLEKIITTSYLYQLNAELKKPDKNVSKIPEGSGKRNILPLELRSGETAPGVSVVGIEFTPTNAYINFISQGNEGGIYAATLIPSTPYGIKSNAHLTALNVAGFERTPVKLLESIETGAVLSDNSKMNCNCKGFESLKEESQLSISTNIMSRADNQAPVTFIPVKKLGNYQEALINVEKIPDFKVRGLNDLTFKANKGVLDLNNSSNNFNNVSNDYTSGLKPNWKGLRLYEVETNLPGKYNIINTKSSLTLDKGEIYIDENELAYGQLFKTNVLDISKGKMGPWNYSIDTMKVTMQGRQFGKFQLNGKIKTPFFDDQFPYNAVVSEGYSQQIQLDAVIPNTKLGMSIWHGNFVSKTPSTIDAKLVQTDNSKLLTPKCSFNGELAIKFNDQEFRNSILNANKGETIDALRKALKIETLDFDLSGLNVAGLSCDPFKEKNKRYKADDFDMKNAKLMFGNAPNKISDGALVYVTEDQRERLGLKTFIIKDNSKVEITIWSESKEGVLTFEGVEVNSIDLKCNCGVADVTPSPRAWDKIIEEFYDKNYSISYSGSASGGTMTFNPMIQSAFLKSVTMEEIKRRAIAWFPSLDENSINIPFLDRNLNIEKSGGSYSGKFKNGRTIDKNTVWTKEIFDGLVNEQAGNLNLPLIITEELWSKFGFKGNYALPENYKLFISEFKAAKNDNLSNATIKVGLVGALNVDGKDVFIQFGSNENLPIGPDKVAFNDVYLHLLKDAKLDEKVTYLSSNDFDKTSESGSYVKLNCTEGVNNFNLQGNVIVKENTIVNSAFQPAVFGFKLIESKIDGNDELLSQFIAPLKTGFKEQNDWKAWSFTTDDDRHIKFSAGNSFEAYLDYSSKDVVSITEDALSELDDFTQIRLSSEYYKGIIFNKMEFQIPLLEQKRDEKGGTPETFKDNVFMSYFEFESNSYFSNYEGINKVPQENNAKLGGWQYHLDTVSYNIAYNSLDEDKLALKGGTRMPLFREAPVKDKDKWLETYSDAWVSYALNVEYNKKDNYPEISGVVDGIEESLFESKHINGLGLKLDAESSVDFNYNNDQGRLIARANLSGRSIYYIEKLDAKIPLLKFQDFNVNYSTSGMCKSNGADGIESIDFGTWSIVDFSEADKAAFAKASTMLAATEKGKSVNTKVKENKFVKGLGNKLDGLSKLASFDVNIHEPSFTCTGDNWKFILGLDLSIMRDKSNLTETQQAAYDKYNPLETATTKQTKAESELKPVADAYKEAQKNIKTIADERTVLVKEKQRLQTELKTFKKDKSIKVNGKDVGYNSASNTKEIETRNNDIAALDKKIADSNTKYKTAIASVKEKYAPFKEQNSKIKEATNEVDKLTKAAVEKQDKYNKSGVKDRLTQDKATFKEKLAEAKETKTGAFSASGDIEVTFNSQGFKDVGLTCLALGGEFGPIKFDGGINLFRDETTKSNFDPNATQSAWGNGFLGMIRLRILEYEFATKFQTGVKLDKATQSTTVDDFRYWFADLSFNSAVGIPLGQTSFNLTGLGGGFYYNMAREIAGLVKKNDVALPPANNDNCKADGMKAGESLSGFQYKVSRGSMGGYLSTEISHTAKISVEGILSLEIALIDGSFKFKNFGFNLNGYVFYEDYFARKTQSTAVIKGEINLNFEEDFKVIGGIDFRFGKKAGPLTIEAPEGKTTDANKWNSVRFLFSKDVNYVHAGSWGIAGNSGTPPASGLNFLSAGFEAPLFGKITAGLYAQIGNKTDGLPSIQYLLPSYTGQVRSLNNSSASKRFAANAGFKLNAEFGNEFLIFKWSAKANIGANLAIENMGKGVTCGGVTEKVGFENGYYLRGNAFAMLDADASIHIPVWGDVSIFDAKVGIVLDFGFPNPSYLEGDFLVEYSVLGGHYSGKQSMKINLGNKPCGAFEPNPIVGIRVF